MSYKISSFVSDLANKFREKEDAIQHLRKNICSVVQTLQGKVDHSGLQVLISDVLNEWNNEACSENLQLFFEEVLSIIDKYFDDKSNSSIMAEALRTNLQISVNKFLFNRQFVEGLREKLMVITPCTMDSFSLFLFDLLWELIDCCILFVCKSMREMLPDSRVGTAKSDANHIITHQVIYHVAGFALYHHVRHAKKYPKNQKLVRMRECILRKFVQEGPNIDYPG